jgi:hypothetical protein
MDKRDVAVDGDAPLGLSSEAGRDGHRAETITRHGPSLAPSWRSATVERRA